MAALSGQADLHQFYYTKVHHDSVQNALLSRQDALPLLIMEISYDPGRLLIGVGVASSHDLYAPLLNRIGALPSKTTWGFETTSIICFTNNLQATSKKISFVCSRLIS